MCLKVVLYLRFVGWTVSRVYKQGKDGWCELFVEKLFGICTSAEFLLVENGKHPLETSADNARISG